MKWKTTEIKDLEDYTKKLEKTLDGKVSHDHVLTWLILWKYQHHQKQIYIGKAHYHQNSNFIYHNIF